MSRLDVAVLVPFQSHPGGWVDRSVRAAFAPTRLASIRAHDRLVELLGVAPRKDVHGAHRSLTAVALATSLERAGFSWCVMDPGPITLGDWRRKIEALREMRPRLVAISSTFVTDGFWIGTLCELVRRILPDARLAIGGYYYAVDVKQFLSLDADILCVGEGEQRFPQIVGAVRDGRALDEIPGLYLRAPGGNLRHTGHAEPLRLDEFPLPDWSLSSRIDPPVDPSRDEIEYHVETQRGCVFKCEFCTFRTLAAPVQSSVETAVRAIRDLEGRHGSIFIVDATATSPRDRWRLVLERLIQAGGSPLPAAVFARATDLDDSVCALMAKANIHEVRIGQESGDQRMLNAMRKGTKVEHIAPAIDALARHGMRAHVYVMFGFPGETAESMASTRRVLRTLNERHPASPVVRGVTVHIFDIQNFAAVQQREVTQGKLRFGYEQMEISAHRAAEEMLLTHIELSRIPHAPYTAFKDGSGLWTLYGKSRERAPLEFFRWAKAVDRLLGLLVEEDVDGKRPSPFEVRRLRAEILDSVAPGSRFGPVRGAALRARHRATWHVLRSWALDQGRDGALTRSAIAWEVARATGRMRDVVSPLLTGVYPTLGILSASRSDADSHARGLLELGINTGRRRLLRSSS